MDKIAIIEGLKSCLGKQLVSAKRRLNEVEGITVSEFDIEEIVFNFDGLGETRYFSWEQVNGDLVLSIRKESHLLDQPRPEILAEDDAILSKLLNKHLTLFELYEDEFGNLVAAMLAFENITCVIAVVQETWNEETQTAQFRSFSGYELNLWTEEEFVDALQKHKLGIVAREEIKTFV